MTYFNNKLTFGFLIWILFIATFSRIWKLNEYPAFNADEAAIGYNAYSLLETGKDEHGNPWPVHFQSFNDYKPGMYFYMIMPFVKVFGLNEWSVRLPNAIAGVLSIVVIFLLALEMFADKKYRNFQRPAALFSALFLAISPWHIHFSRGGWEVNVATFFILVGVYLLIRFVRSRKFFELLVSGIFFVFSLYTYHAARVIFPLLGLGIIFLYRDVLFTNFKKLVLVFIVSFILLLPLSKDLLSGQIASRAIGVGLFADPGPLSRVNEQRSEHSDYQSLISKVYHNKPINYGLAFVNNWVRHYHGEFLFLSGDIIERNRVPETGQMNIVDIVFLVFGIWFLVRNTNKHTSLILWWLIIAPTAAALTFQSPHALRAQNMTIPLALVCGVGLALLWSKAEEIFKNRFYVNFIHFIFLAIIGLSFARYLHMYWVHMSKEYKFSSQYGVKELVNYVQNQNLNYIKILVTDRYDQPYILFLFYLKYPPDKFQNNHVLLGRDKYGFSTVPAFDRYEFRSINFDKDVSNYKNYLIAGTNEEIPEATNIVARIYGSNGLLYFKVVAN